MSRRECKQKSAFLHNIPKPFKRNVSTLKWVASAVCAAFNNLQKKVNIITMKKKITYVVIKDALASSISGKYALDSHAPIKFSLVTGAAKERARTLRATSSQGENIFWVVSSDWIRRHLLWRLGL